MAGRRGDGGGGRAERERAGRNFLERGPGGRAPRPGRRRAGPSGARAPGRAGRRARGAAAGRAGRTHLLPNFPGIYLGNFRSEAEAVFPPSRRDGWRWGGRGANATPKGGEGGREKEPAGWGVRGGGEKIGVTSFRNGGTARTRRPPARPRGAPPPPPAPISPLEATFAKPRK